MERLGRALPRLITKIQRYSTIRTSRIRPLASSAPLIIRPGTTTQAQGVVPLRDSNKRNEGNSRDGKSAGRWSRAIPGVLASFSLFGIGAKKEDIDQLNVTVNSGRRAMDEQNYDEADRLFHEALKILETRKQNATIDEKEFIEKRTFVFDCLANLYFTKGDVRSGEALYKETLKGLFASGYEQTDNAVIEISVKLANVNAMQKRSAEAIAGYKYCIDAQQRKFDSGITDDDTLALWGLCVDSYARFLVWTRDFAKSRELFEKALELSVKLRGSTHEQTLVILNSLATVAVETNDLDAAEGYLKRAIDCAEENAYPDRAAFYVNLAGVYFQKKQFDKALELGKNALKIAIEVKDKESEEQANLIVKMMSLRTAGKNPA
ncbi:tetratricopeptide repeat protein 19, mitochondrial-like [Tubulanus polymorphus]|uniref:tetratricopeptide repeat protein 19, mitochondrial-like n=1 Tax=Tubulanus polymorphus TaxID=672921 RepID=UPI003DA3B363